MNIKPPQLNKGDTIGIIAPASPSPQTEIQPAIDLLIKRGYKIFQGPHLYDQDSYLAGDDDARLSDFNLMFQRKEIKAILCARGGYGTLRIIDKINYEFIQQNPKIIIGYSDITALLFALFKKTGLVTFHGPMTSSLLENKNRNLDHLLETISSFEPLKLELTDGEVIRKGKAKGILLGGNLSMISRLIGTQFMPSLKGVILFIEEKGESLYRIDRILTHMRLSGLFDQLSGLIIGRFEDCDDFSAIKSLLDEFTLDLHIPVITGLPVGHGDMNITLPMGVSVELDTGIKRVSSLESCLTYS